MSPKSIPFVQLSTRNSLTNIGKLNAPEDAAAWAVGRDCRCSEAEWGRTRHSRGEAGVEVGAANENFGGTSGAGADVDSGGWDAGASKTNVGSSVDTGVDKGVNATGTAEEAPNVNLGAA